MTPLVSIATLGWAVVVPALFLVMPARRAVLVGYIGGWLFLPMAGFTFVGIPDYTKHAAVSIPVLVGSLLFDSRVWARLRPRMIDVPMAVFCLSPYVTTALMGSNVLGDPSHVLTQLFRWGIPYAVGRAYFRDWRHLRELAIGVFIGGLVYLPFVWYEIRMSPQLHRMVYGFFQHSFLQHIRYGGFRPIVFMQHGIMLGFWMAAASLTGLWLWQSRSLVRLWGAPMALLVPVLIVTTVFCKSANGILLLGVGIVVLFATRLLRSPIPLLALALVAPAYIALRATDLWSGGDLVSLIASVDSTRAGSLDARMRQEDVYTDQAFERPFFGWGGGGMIPTNEAGHRLVRGNDGFWIITFGLYGLVSLVSVFLAILLPAMVLILRIPAGTWTRPDVGPTVSLAVVVTLFAIDCLSNGMLNPVYALAIGGGCGVGSFVASGARPRHHALGGRRGDLVEYELDAPMQREARSNQST